MSYGPPPKTAYGDQDFIKEDFAQENRQQQMIYPPSSNLAGGSYNSIEANNNQSSYAQSNPYPKQTIDSRLLPRPGQHSGQQQQLNPFNEALQSMTPEDVLFMKSWRQDTFFYKVLPISIIANGAYFYHNKTKGQPTKPLRYLFLTGASYLVGVWISRGDLRQRIIESRLNTPFMQALKQLNGSPGRSNEFFMDSSLDQSSGWSTTNDGFSRRPYPPPQSATTSPYSSSPSSTPGNQSYPYDPYGPVGAGGMNRATGYDSPAPADGNYSGNSADLESKPMTSYEELRARNRGQIPPTRSL